MSELLDLSARTAAAAVAAGELDPKDLVAAYHGQAAADALGAYVHVPEQVPRVADGAGGLPLAGLPLAVKDLFCVAGQPTQS